MNNAVSFRIDPREGGGYALVFFDRNGDQCGMRVCATVEEAEVFGNWQVKAVPTGKEEW